MDNNTQRVELERILKEYSSYFESAELKSELNSYYRASENPGSYLKLTTSDGQTLEVSVNLKGWHLLKDRNDLGAYQETFEALMTKVYPKFHDKFGSELTNKLLSIQQI